MSKINKFFKIKIFQVIIGIVQYKFRDGCKLPIFVTWYKFSLIKILLVFEIIVCNVEVLM